MSQGRLFKGTIFEFWTDAEMAALDLMIPDPEPKTFEWPRLYFNSGRNEFAECDRLRIICPDGRCYWTDNYDDRTAEFYDQDWFFEMKPCWIIGKKPKDGFDALERMRKHDMIAGFPKSEFVGEIK